MASTTAKSFFWRGFWDSTPFIFVAGPFGMLFGVLATEAGLNLVETMTFTTTVFAGAAQFTALQLMQDQAPTLIVIATALAVNLRVAMYSASLTPYLGAAPLWQRAIVAYFTVDQSYALSVVKFEKEPALTLPQRLAYFAGTNAAIAPVWYGATLLGALMGARIPESLALDFALPICFLAMIGPALRTAPHVIAALTAIVLSLATAGLPYNSGLLVAGILGMMAGAEAERRLERGKTT
ncbi:MAG: AzlC family ABC transporter permease [Sedimentitalea sp.]